MSDNFHIGIEVYAARREAEHIANDLTSFIARRQAGVDAGPYLHNARIALAHLAKALGYDLVEVEPETEPDPLDAETVATREAQTPGYGADALYDAQREAQQ